MGDNRTGIVVMTLLSARKQQRDPANNLAPKRRGATGIVLKIDPAICEPDGLDPQAEYEFCEKMTDYWANRTVAAMKRAQGEEPAQPRPKRTRGKGTAKRPRKKKTSGLSLGDIAKQVLPMAAAVAIGNLFSDLMKAPATRHPASDLPGHPFLLPKGSDDGK